jgi:hypothetical protein
MPLVGVNVPDDYFCMAGFEVIMYGRIWPIPEGAAMFVQNCMDKKASGA